MILDSEDERQNKKIIPVISEDPETEDLVGPFHDRILFPTTKLQIYSTIDGFSETDMISEVVGLPVERRVHFVDLDSSAGNFLQQDRIRV